MPFEPTKRITRENLEGMWASIPTPWTQSGEFDQEGMAEMVSRFEGTGIHGAYVTDSTGEFYAIEIDEYKRIVRTFADEARRIGLPTMAGVTWVNTKGILDRLAAASECGIGAVHITNPFWMPLSKKGLIRFWRDVSRFAPQMPLVHYNTPRARHDYSPEEYRRILDEAPNLVGTKFARTDLNLLADILREVPELSHFVNEYIFPFGLMLGARGCYSFLADMNPAYALEWYRLCREGNWGEAVTRLKRVLDWRARVMRPLYEERYYHATNDKTKAATSDFLPANLVTRAPYYMPDADMIAMVRERTRREFPEFVV